MADQPNRRLRLEPSELAVRALCDVFVKQWLRQCLTDYQPLSIGKQTLGRLSGVCKELRNELKRPSFDGVCFVDGDVNTAPNILRQMYLLAHDESQPDGMSLTAVRRKFTDAFAPLHRLQVLHWRNVPSQAVSMLTPSFMAREGLVLFNALVPNRETFDTVLARWSTRNKCSIFVSSALRSPALGFEPLFAEWGVNMVFADPHIVKPLMTDAHCIALIRKICKLDCSPEVQEDLRRGAARLFRGHQGTLDVTPTEGWSEQHIGNLVNLAGTHIEGGPELIVDMRYAQGLTARVFPIMLRGGMLRHVTFEDIARYVPGDIDKVRACVKLESLCPPMHWWRDRGRACVEDEKFPLLRTLVWCAVVVKRTIVAEQAPFTVEVFKEIFGSYAWFVAGAARPLPDSFNPTLRELAETFSACKWFDPLKVVMRFRPYSLDDIQTTRELFPEFVARHWDDRMSTSSDTDPGL